MTKSTGFVSSTNRSNATEDARRVAHVQHWDPTEGQHRANFTVGQGHIEPDPVHPEVAKVRYLSVIASIFILTAVSGWKLNWSLPVVMIIFSALSLASIWLLSLIETKQIQGVMNAIFDYNLNAKQLEIDSALKTNWIEAAQFLDFYELRHRHAMERQQFLIDNQMTIAQFIQTASGQIPEATAAKLIANVSPGQEPGTFVDTVVEDQMAEALIGYLVSLFDVDKSGNYTKIASDGRIVADVPWSIDGPMTDADRDIVIGIFNRITSRMDAIMTEDEDGQWWFNHRVYDKPIKVVKAFDVVYQM